MAHRTLTDTTIAALKPKAKRYSVADPQLPGHYVRVTPTGAKSFAAVARDKNGKQIWHTVGSTSLFTLDEARTRARTAIIAIKDGQDHSGPQTFAAVSEQWLKRHVEAKELRTAGHIKTYLRLHILPTWGGRDFESIRRGDVARLLDDVEDKSGPVAADHTLQIAGSIFNWYATRHEDYSSPVVRGMRRSNPKDRARDRILSDDELRAVWKQADGVFGAFIRMLLLTGQRAEKVRTMRWDDLRGDTWLIRTEAREKGNAGEIKLPQIALDIINAQPRFASNPYVFAGERNGKAMAGDRERKRDFVAKLPPMPEWRLHDLRRTARSLMSRAGVRPDVAERVLGHAMGGVEGIYDRHRYTEEKAHALQALAGLIENILRPQETKVQALRA